LSCPTVIALLLHPPPTFPISPTSVSRPMRRIGNGNANDNKLPKPRNSQESFVTALQTAQLVAQEVAQEVVAQVAHAPPQEVVAQVAPAPPQATRGTR
jgi:hypothetical protein